MITVVALLVMLVGAMYFLYEAAHIEEAHESFDFDGKYLIRRD